MKTIYLFGKGFILFLYHLFIVFKNFPRIILFISPKYYNNTYYKEEKIKNKLMVAKELAIWLIRYGELNENYYKYGCERVNCKTFSYMPYNKLIKLREYGNRRRGFGKEDNYTILLRDKFVFAQFFSSLGFKVPQTISILNSQNYFIPTNRNELPITDIFKELKPNTNYYCKELNGMCATGVYKLKHDGNHRLFIDDNLTNLSSVKKIIKNDFILQEELFAHEKLQNLTGSKSLSTMRIFTINDGVSVKIFYGIIKLIVGNNIVDNWNKGNLLVKINVGNGTLDKNAYLPLEYGGILKNHPDTKIEIRNFEIPLFEEACNEVKEIHRFLPNIKTIGWDVAVTNRGIVVIEGNDNWGGAFIQIVDDKGWRQWMLKNLN